MSKAIMNIFSARVADTVTYIPAYSKQGGKEIQQRVTIPCMLNENKWTDDDGVRHDGAVTVMFITAWGKQADVCAKYLAVGKEFHCDVRVNSYESKIIDPATKTAILDAAGAPIITIKHGFTMIPGTFQFGNDSAAQIEKEGRNLGWDGKLPINLIEGSLATGEFQNILAQAKQGKAAWEITKENLKKLAYIPGMTTFGEAKVRVASDAVQPTAYNNLASQVAAATANTGGVPKVDGFTYDDMIKGGWNDPLLLSHNGGYYASLVPKKVPTAPPVAPAVPV